MGFLLIPTFELNYIRISKFRGHLVGVRAFEVTIKLYVCDPLKLELLMQFNSNFQIRRIENIMWQIGSPSIRTSWTIVPGKVFEMRSYVVHGWHCISRVMHPSMHSSTVIKYVIAIKGRILACPGTPLDNLNPFCYTLNLTNGSDGPLEFYETWNVAFMPAP